MIIYTDNHTCGYEVRHLIAIFFKDRDLEVIDSDLKETENREYIYTGLSDLDNGMYEIKIDISFDDYKKTCKQTISDKNKKTVQKAFAEVLYRELQSYTSVTPEWGILTGVRPIKLIHEYRNQGLSDNDIKSKFQDEYHVSKERTNLAFLTADNQKTAIQLCNEKEVSLYIGIPFCPTRCVYCSFVSQAISSAKKLMPIYLDKLCKEIEYVANILKELGLGVSTIYIGGGTPTSLSVEQLEILLSEINSLFDLKCIKEFTVEAGRVDTITKEKLITLKKYGVNRISINPQTMVDEVIKTTGRTHTAKDIIDCYSYACKIGFDVINMDLIAGLPNDTYDGFCYSIDELIKLNPENITIHTLSLKRSSKLTIEENIKYSAKEDIVKPMLDYGYKKLIENGYSPYYLYRQKNMRENLENIGFTKKNKENLYNIYMMDEMQTVIACGAGSNCKLIKGDNEKHIYNFKYPFEYINRFDEILNRKDNIRDFYKETL